MAAQDISLTIGAPRVLSEQEFNAVRAQVLAAAPNGLDQAGFERYIGPALAAAVAAAEQQPAAPALGLGIEDQLKALATLMTSRTEGAPGVAVGAAKGAAKSATTVGRWWHQVPGVSPGINALDSFMQHQLPGVTTGFTPMDSHPSMNATADESVLGLNAQNGAEQLGKMLEQMSEYLAPGMAAETSGAKAALQLKPFLRPLVARLAPRMITQAGANAAVTKLQGGNVPIGAITGAAGPVAGELGMGASQLFKGEGESLVRAAVKPTVSAMRSVAGASVTGIDTVAQRLARFIIDNRLTTPDKAQAIINDVEVQIPKLINAAGNPISDAAKRAASYLKDLGRSAAKQGLPAEDVAIIQGKMKDLLHGPLGKDVTTLAPKLTATGRTMQPVTTRALRTDVRAKEALDIARHTSKWRTGAAYGEMKGAATEASKATERGLRDAAKEAVPALKPALARESQAMNARNALTRMKFRQANRDAISLPAHVLAAGEIASGHVPVLAFAANWLRNHQLQAGIYADDLANFIAHKDVKGVIRTLGRLGVKRGVTAATQRPQAASR